MKNPGLTWWVLFVTFLVAFVVWVFSVSITNSNDDSDFARQCTDRGGVAVKGYNTENRLICISREALR